MHMCTGMCVDMCIDKSADMVSRHLASERFSNIRNLKSDAMRTDMCIDMRIDMCIYIYVHNTYRHMSTHV